MDDRVEQRLKVNAFRQTVCCYQQALFGPLHILNARAPFFRGERPSDRLDA